MYSIRTTKLFVNQRQFLLCLRSYMCVCYLTWSGITRHSLTDRSNTCPPTCFFVLSCSPLVPALFLFSFIALHCYLSSLPPQKKISLFLLSSLEDAMMIQTTRERSLHVIWPYPILILNIGRLALVGPKPCDGLSKDLLVYLHQRNHQQPTQLFT